MDPQEWQRLAEQVAQESSSALDEVEAEFWPNPADPSFRSFWPRIRDLSERLRTAPAIDIENKLALLGRIRQLTKRAREDQESFFAEQRHRKQEFIDRIAELRDRAISSSDPAEVREVRQELTAMRDSISGVELPTRGDRQQTWQSWQSATQAVWDHLTTMWTGNEEQLSSLLDDVKAKLDHGKVREARDAVRRFNTLLRELEVSHKGERVLRDRANTLWKEANEVAKTKHETFVATAPQRMERMKQVRGRNATAIGKLRAEVSELEQNIDAGGVAAAFARAMIDEKLRELERLESTNDSLEERIETTEEALAVHG